MGVKALRCDTSLVAELFLAPEEGRAVASRILRFRGISRVPKLECMPG